VIGLPELILATMLLRMLSHTAGTPTITLESAYISSAVPDRDICEGLDAFVTALHAHEYAPVRGLGVDKRGIYIFR
jgi:hypothetical protein